MEGKKLKTESKPEQINLHIIQMSNKHTKENMERQTKRKADRSNLSNL